MKQLRQIPGVTVYVVGQPLDLLVGYRKRTYLGDVKNPDTGHGLTADQQKFVEAWTGDWYLWETLDDVLRTIGVTHAPEETRCRENRHEPPRVDA